ncbi:MAG: WD40 repeat domain-containing protein [Anaerolineae bacterium]
MNNQFGDNLRLTLLTFTGDNQQLLLNVQAPSSSLNSSLVVLNADGDVDDEITFGYETIWGAGTYSPNGELLALANEIDNSIHFFDTSNMREIGSVVTGAASITHLTFSPDGTLASWAQMARCGCGVPGERITAHFLR